jgi:hypothetical protein
MALSLTQRCVMMISKEDAAAKGAHNGRRH